VRCRFRHGKENKFVLVRNNQKQRLDRQNLYYAMAQ
jgi:hypothetical protein